MCCDITVINARPCYVPWLFVFFVCREQILEERGVKESMRFDPKLKGRGLLDLYIEKAKPDTSVPK